jgi:hypothetical protein
MNNLGKCIMLIVGLCVAGSCLKDNPRCTKQARRKISKTFKKGKKKGKKGQRQRSAKRMKKGTRGKGKRKSSLMRRRKK